MSAFFVLFVFVVCSFRDENVSYFSVQKEFIVTTTLVTLLKYLSKFVCSFLTTGPENFDRMGVLRQQAIT